MSFSGRHAVVLALVAVGLFAAGCGETVIDDAKTEDAIEQNVQSTVGLKVSSVDCPSDVKVETDTTFRCTVILDDGEEQTATLKILNEDADVEFLDLAPVSKVRE
jgi:hypothetical protein